MSAAILQSTIDVDLQFFGEQNVLSICVCSDHFQTLIGSYESWFDWLNARSFEHDFEWVPVDFHYSSGIQKIRF